MRIDLTGRVALVIGGSGGLGQPIAQSLAATGAIVGLTSRSKEKAEQIALEMRSATQNPDVHGLALDLGQVTALQAAIVQFGKQFGRIDILINSAGEAITSPALDVSEAEWDRVVDTDLKGVFFACQAAARIMKVCGGGRIINISSVLGSRASGGVSSYCSSKAALNHLTRALSLEWARHDIQVNAVAPGYVRTEMNREFMDKPNILAKLVERIPMRRLTEPEEVAKTVLYLASDWGKGTTGQVLIVDNGYSIA